jgi:hypothetical protein
MAAQTTHLLLPDDLGDAARTSGVAATDRDALRAVSDWIRDFVVRPHQDLGRDGTVCPFVPGSLERQVLFFAPEQVADLDGPEVVELMDDHKRLFLATPPINGDDAIYKTIIVVFTDLAAERAAGLFDDVLGQLAGPAYEEHGIIFGPSTRATGGPPSTTRTSGPSGPSGRRCRSSSCGARCSVTGSSSWTTRPGSTAGLVVSDRPRRAPSPRSSGACPGAWGVGDAPGTVSAGRRVGLCTRQPW